MAYTDQYSLSQDTTFRQRIRVGIVTAAIAIRGESVGSMGPEHYRKRDALAGKVLIDPAAWVDRFSTAVTTNAAITGSSTDADIQFTINSMWDDVAGYTAELDGA